jgi:hypothetical protein
MPRWFPRFFLCIFFYFTSVWVVGRLASAAAYMFVKGHSLVLWQLQHEHPFGNALVVGFLAGMVPLETWLAASGLIDRRITVFLRRLRPDRLKPWICVFLSPLILLAVLSWTIDWFDMNSRHSSVLQTTAPYPMSVFFEGFLSSNCSDLADWRGDMWGDRYVFRCTTHVQLISAWVLALGYSLVPIVFRRVLPLFSNDHPEPANKQPDENLPESTITENTDSQ